MTFGQSALLRRSLAIQLRVLHALLMREAITRFGRDNLGVLWLVAEPMLFTVGVAALWTFAGMRHGYGISPVALAVTGYSSVLMWRNATSRCGSALEQNRNLLFHRNVRAADVFAARILLEVCGATASFAILASTCIYLGWMPLPGDMLKVLIGWLLLAWFGSSLALMMGSATAFSRLVDRFWHPAAYLLFPLSGAAFMVDWLPKGMQSFVLLVPMVHGTEMIREGWFGRAVHARYDVGYIAMCSLLLSVSGLYLAKIADRRDTI